MLHEVIFYMYTIINIFQHFIIDANIIIYMLSQMDAVMGHKILNDSLSHMILNVMVAQEHSSLSLLF